MEPDEIIEAYARIPTSTICDALVRSGIRRPEQVFIPCQPLHDRRERVAGRARTQRSTLVRDPDRSAMVVDRRLSFEVVEGARRGDFLVVSGPAGPPYAIWGGSLALVASRRGAAGVLVDGYVRDTHELAELNARTWVTHGVTAIAGGYGGYSVEAVNVTVVCGGVEVVPGDYVIADGDGVVVVPSGEAMSLLEHCRDMDAKERSSHAALTDGASMLDTYPSRGYYQRSDRGAPPDR